MSEHTRPETAPPDLRSRVAEVIDAHIFMDAGGWNINRASLRRTSEEIHALYNSALTRLQREVDEADAALVDAKRAGARYFTAWQEALQAASQENDRAEVAERDRDRAREEVERLHSGLLAADSVMWMAERYAQEGGSGGPEMRDYLEAEGEIRAALQVAKREVRDAR